MNGIICSFYEHGMCTHTSPVMSIPDALKLVEQYQGNDTVIVVGSNSETGEAIIKSAYHLLYEQDGIPYVNK